MRKKDEIIQSYNRMAAMIDLYEKAHRLDKETDIEQAYRFGEIYGTMYALEWVLGYSEDLIRQSRTMLGESDKGSKNSSKRKK